MTIPDKEGVVYSLEFPNGKKYIGVTTTGLRKRLNNHNCNPSKTSKISNAVKEFGKDVIVVEELEKFNTREEALILEEKYIKENNTIENGYNTYTSGLESTREPITEEQRKNLSNAQKRRYLDENEREKISVAQKKWIEENPEKHKENAKVRKEKMNTPEYKARASQIRKKVAEERPDIGENHSNFMLNRYKENPELRLKVSKQKGGTPIEVYKDGEKIAEYDMVVDCARDLGLSTGNISQILQGTGRKQTKGYTFKRKENVT